MTAVDETAVIPMQRAGQHAVTVETARARWFREVRAQLDLIEAREDLPLPYHLAIEVAVSAFLDPEAARNVVGAAAALLGVEPTTKDGRFGARVASGLASYEVFAMSPAVLHRSAEVRRLGLAAFEEASGTPAPESLVAEMASAPKVEPVAPEAPAEEPKPAKKAVAARAAKARPAEKRDGGESE